MSYTEEGMGTAIATNATLTNKAMAVHNVYSLEGTIGGDVPIEVRENAGADNNANSHLSGGLAWDGFTPHEDAPVKSNSFAENAL